MPGAPRWAAAVYDDVDDDDENDDDDESRGNSRGRSNRSLGRNTEATDSLPPLAGAADYRGVGSLSSSSSLSGGSSSSSSAAAAAGPSDDTSNRRSALEFDHEVSDDDDEDVSGDFGGGNGGSGSSGTGSKNIKNEENESLSCWNSYCLAPYQCVVEQITSWTTEVLPGLWSQLRQVCLDSLRAAVAYTVPD